ncbi:MAG: hypothetical protein JXA96_14950 [Sedimentisphaerales bacterium]|nr:hypothetical protein [Sedimentisphaerales bacterium]
MNIKIHISKKSITFLDESDILLEECENNLSSPRILVQDIMQAEEFFAKIIRKHCRGIIRPKVTLDLDENIFDDEITNTEERALFNVLFKAGIRKLIYKGEVIGYNT